MCIHISRALNQVKEVSRCTINVVCYQMLIFSMLYAPVIELSCVCVGTVPGGTGSGWRRNESCQHCLQTCLPQRTCGEYQGTGTGTHIIACVYIHCSASVSCIYTYKRSLFSILVCLQVLVCL